MHFPCTFPGWALFLMLLLSGCSHMQEARESIQTAQAAAQAARHMDQALDLLEAQHAARSARGDTLSLHFRELQKFLPAAVAGFAPDGRPHGETVNMGGVSYSTCEQRYHKGNQRMKVQIVDYNGANALYAGATAMMAAGFWQENDEQLVRGCDLGIPHVQGFETLQKKEHRAAVALGVGDRFFVSIESDQQQSTELVRNVARAMNLPQMTRL